jgi:competence protein ComFB
MDIQELFDSYPIAQLENMWMPLVLEVVIELLNKEEVCDCQECVLDLVALALNQLQPRYWVSGKFNAFTPPETFLKSEENRKTARETVMKALKLVTKNPHH